MKTCVDSQNEFKTVNAKRDDELKILVRMGIHYGELSFKEMGNKNIDIYGKAVNYAARVTTYSDEYEIICSKAFFDNYNISKKRWNEHKDDDNIEKIEQLKARTEELGERYIKNDIAFMKDCKNNYNISQKIKLISKTHASLKGFRGLHELFKTIY